MLPFAFACVGEDVEPTTKNRSCIVELLGEGGGGVSSPLKTLAFLHFQRCQQHRRIKSLKPYPWRAGGMQVHGGGSNACLAKWRCQ
jgi:hypothetical protein